MSGSTFSRWRCAAGVALVAVLSACGDDAVTPTPVPTPSATAPPTTLPPATLLAQETFKLDAFQVTKFDVEVPRPGRLDITVTYTFADSLVLLWLTDRVCSHLMFQRDVCDYLVKSLEGSTPRRMTVPSVAAGEYSLFIANDGPYDETMTFKVELTP
jgi:hypothetical protein